MKSRVLVLFGVLVAMSVLFTFLAFEITGEQHTCEQMGGMWNGDHCIVTQEMVDSNRVKCDPGPVFGDGYCYSNGIKMVFESKPELKPGDKYYIEPERKAQLEAVELDLRNKIKQFHKKNPLSSFAINLDHHTKEIVVIVENEQFNSEIEKMISQYPDDIPIVFSNGKIMLDDFEYSPTIHIITEDGDDKLNPHQVVIDLEQTNVVTFVNNSPDPVRIQEVGENKIINIPKTAWHTKTIESGKNLTMQFNSTGYYEFNVKKITDFLEGYFEHHASGDIVVLSNDTNSLPVDVRAKMAQSIVSSYFHEHPALHGVGSGGAPGTGVSISINEKELELREDAESYYYELYRNLIPFDVPITIEFSAPPRLLTG